jgi:predicted transport protein
MPLFNINNDKLKPVKEKFFDLEKNLQNITENNLSILFGLELVSTEFQLKNLRIDSLAYNPETNSFVIIEYKRDKNMSVIDQGFSYLSLMLHNKADFILEYNEKMKHSLRRKDIDWDQSRVYFISPQFTTHQQNAINFKNLPIELWQVIKYENNLILYSKIEASNTTESITELTKDKKIQEVSKEIKNYTEEDHLNKNNKGSYLYKKLKEKILLINSELEIHATKNYISFRYPNDWRNIITVFIQTNKLKIDLLRSKPNQFKDPEGKVSYKEGSIDYWHQHISTINIKNEEELDYAIFIIKQLYERFEKENFN